MKRPADSNADEWNLFLSEWLRIENGRIEATAYCAVQIGEAIDAQVEDLTRELERHARDMGEYRDRADKMTRDLKTALDREAATTKRYDDRIEALQTQVEDLTQRLARHEAHDYEQRAWAAEARVEELTRWIGEIDAALTATEPILTELRLARRRLETSDKATLSDTPAEPAAP